MAKRHPGFTLVEVLVALIILLLGAYVALSLFPSGFAAIERGRLETMAARLAQAEIQRWRLAAGSLPEAIVWADSSSGSVIYNTDFDPADLTPDEDNPNWQPDSAYLPRTIIGEALPVGDVTVTVADPDGVDPDAEGIRVPLCRLRFGPLQHLYDDPADGDPLFIYTTQYERVDRAQFLSDAKDWGRYYIDYAAGTISFDYVPDYPRRFRVEFAYLTSDGPGARGERRYDMWQTAEMITIAAGENTKATPRDLWPGPPGASRPANFAGVVPLSERVHQALILDNDDWPLNGPGYFKLVGTGANPINDPSAYLLFHPTDGGRTVQVDYRVRDWQIITEERTPDETLELNLAIWPLKGPDYVNPPRQPAAPDRLIPGDDAMVIIVDTEDGTRLTGFSVNYETGHVRLGSAAQAGKTYRVYYRAEQDWTLQPMKAAAEYAVMVNGDPGYRHAVWSEGTDKFEFGRSEVAKSVVANYFMYADPPANTRPRLVTGELHRVMTEDGRALVHLDATPAWGDIRLEGASMRARVLWAGRGRTRAAGGQYSPESWRQIAVDAFLRRP